MRKSSTDSNEDKFLYSYLDDRIGNETFSKLFEIKSDPSHFFVFGHNNKKKNFSNLRNPFYGEISISRVNKSHYLEHGSKDQLYDRVMERQPIICLHDFVPGTV